MPLIPDLLGIHPFSAQQHIRPEDLTSLQKDIRGARFESIRAAGSYYSLSDAGVAAGGVIIDTSKLDRPLSLPYPYTSQIDSLRNDQILYNIWRRDVLRQSSDAESLQKIFGSISVPSNTHYVHVEAGIKIKDLLRTLDQFGLALPTMGSGGGQSLIGALATSSHGADFREKLLVDRIVAVHLLDAQGREQFISGKLNLKPVPSPHGGRAQQVEELFQNNIRTCFEHNRGLLPSGEDWHPKFIADDDLLNAVKVAVGRVGVIYSVILEVVPKYFLLESNKEHQWSEVIPQLYAPITKESPIFDSFEHLRDIGDGPIGSIARQVDSQLHHINIAINLAHTNQCWITRRWRSDAELPSVNLAQETSENRKQILQVILENDSRTAVDKIIERIIKDNLGFFHKLVGGESRAQRAIDQLLLDPHSPSSDEVRVLDSVIDLAKTVPLELNRETAQELLRRIGKPLMDAMREELPNNVPIFYRLISTLRVFLKTEDLDDLYARLGFTRATLANLLSAKAMESQFPSAVRSGPSASILDTHGYDLDGIVSSDSAEFFFDAREPQFLDFIEEVRQLAQRDEYSPIFGFIGIRFMPKAEALLAMQHWDLTVSVEVAVMRSQTDSRTSASPAPETLFFREVCARAAAVGAVPHWGQEFSHSKQQIERAYGDRLTKWRKLVTSLGLKPSFAEDSFDTAFARNCGLQREDYKGYGMTRALVDPRLAERVKQARWFVDQFRPGLGG